MRFSGMITAARSRRLPVDGEPEFISGLYILVVTTAGLKQV